LGGGLFIEENVKLKIDEIKDTPADEVLKKLDSSKKGLSPRKLRTGLSSMVIMKLPKRRSTHLKNFSVISGVQFPG
jgi:H+-transporting ATPase